MRKNSNRFKRKNKRDYNCGGYALGTYDWFVPYSCSYLDEYLEDDVEKFYKRVDEAFGKLKVLQVF